MTKKALDFQSQLGIMINLDIKITHKMIGNMD